MIQVKFKNLERSEMVRELVQDRVQALIDKFPDLNKSRILVTLEMENSPTQAGPDLFKVKLHVSQGRYSGVTLTKKNSNLYVALAEVIDNMLENLNRFGDRARVKDIKKARHFSRKLENSFLTIEQEAG